jgi:hypothetical protein
VKYEAESLTNVPGEKRSSSTPLNGMFGANSGGNANLSNFQLAGPFNN